MQQFLIALAVCHTVKTETIASTGEITYQVRIVLFFSL